MNYIFLISNANLKINSPRPIIKSTRTTNPVRAFTLARKFPSAVVVWDVENGEAIAAESFYPTNDNIEKLNKFFDFLRKGASL